jgi:hypothetical protein
MKSATNRFSYGAAKLETSAWLSDDSNHWYTEVQWSLNEQYMVKAI